MNHTIALNFEDGATRFINCGPHETVVDAAYRQGVNIPIDCREGACGTCKCKVEAGQYVLADYIEDALSEAEAAQGFALTCQMRPTSDCVLLVPTSSALCNTKQAVFSAAIKAVQPLSDSTFSLIMQSDALKKLSFLPGQYAKLQVPGTDQHRAYSFSAMAQADEASFLIRNVPNGLMSQFLKDVAQVGMALNLTGPFGSFYLRDIRRPVLMLAGGTGLAPFLAMLDKVLAVGGSAHPIHLIYGVNTDQDLVELEHLELLTKLMPNFSFAVCVVDPNSSQPRKGYVTHHIDAGQLHDGNVDVYLCGPPPMVEAVSVYLHEKNIKTASFHYEKFAASVP